MSEAVKWGWPQQSRLMAKHTEQYFYINTIQHSTTIVRHGKVGSSPLSGSVKSGSNSAAWRLTARK